VRDSASNTLLAKFKQLRGLEGVALRLGLPKIHFFSLILSVLYMMSCRMLQNVHRQQSFISKIQNKANKSK
jgi:hypothetical protein